ncbi:MAG: hypothetical protein JHC33_14210 [Ignisphaera sp.]|nr:hypothetical protein [Ignisphaera sp.]
MKVYKVVKGDSTINLKFIVSGYATLDNNWKCSVSLADDLDPTTVPQYTKDVPLTSDSSGFNVNFSPDETAMLPIIQGSIYYWIVVVSNLTMVPAYKRTTTNKLEIDIQGA